MRLTIQSAYVRVLVGMVLLALCAQTGCVSDGPEQPKPELGPKPRNPQADVLLLNLAQPGDSDGDTAPDTIVASVHMFDQRYQLPVTVSGTLTFRLFSRDAKVLLHEWSYEGADLQSRMMMAQVGPTYQFRLRLPLDSPNIRDSFVTVQCEMRSESGQVSRAWHRGLPWMSVPG